MKTALLTPFCLLRKSPAGCFYRSAAQSCLAPAFGYRGSGLFQYYAQSKCLTMIEDYERNRSRVYDRVMWMRVDAVWLHPHPPLSILPTQYAWVPRGDDYAGINDRHLLINRTVANIVFRRWEVVVTGKAIDTLCYSGFSGDSEKYLWSVLALAHVPVGRFPNVLFFECCPSKDRCWLPECHHAFLPYFKKYGFCWQGGERFLLGG